MTIVRDLSNLGTQLKNSTAVNAVKQMISLVDVRIEASMREMEQLKKLLEKLETYERKES